MADRELGIHPVDGEYTPPRSATSPETGTTNIARHYTLGMLREIRRRSAAVYLTVYE